MQALSDALPHLPRAEGAALRGLARDFRLDLGDVEQVDVELFAADALCALIGDLSAPTCVRVGVTVAVRVAREALVNPPTVATFAEALKPLVLDARPVDQQAVRACFGRLCGGCQVRPSFR